MTAFPPAALVDLPDAALWSSRTWEDFAGAPPALAVLPLFGFADWGVGRPLDLEETLGAAVLRRAGAAARNAGWVALPPLRFVHAPFAHCAFGVDFEIASDLLVEIARSVAAAGVDKLALFHASPWADELAYSNGCDIHEQSGLRVYRVSLAALGLDLHPVRSKTRDDVQCAAAACFAAAPETSPRAGDVRAAELRPAHVVQPPPARLTIPLDEAVQRGEHALHSAGARLARLLEEIVGHALPAEAAGERPSQSIQFPNTKRAR